MTILNPTVPTLDYGVLLRVEGIAFGIVGSTCTHDALHGFQKVFVLGSPTPEHCAHLQVCRPCPHGLVVEQGASVLVDDRFCIVARVEVMGERNATATQVVWSGRVTVSEETALRAVMAEQEGHRRLMRSTMRHLGSEGEDVGVE